MGDQVITGLELSPELEKTLDRAARDRFERAPAPEDELSSKVVAKLVAHARGCASCQALTLEDAPSATRRTSRAELRDAEAAEAQDREAKKRKFFISLGYAVPAFLGAQTCLNQYRIMRAREVQSGPQITAKNEAKLAFHPLQIGFALLLLVAVWGLSEAWTIAHELWIDWTQAKAAVPFIGKAWAARSKKP